MNYSSIMVCWLICLYLHFIMRNYKESWWNQVLGQLKMNVALEINFAKFATLPIGGKEDQGHSLWYFLEQILQALNILNKHMKLPYRLLTEHYLPSPESLVKSFTSLVT